MMLDRQLNTTYRVCCDVCRRPAGAAWQVSADEAEAQAAGCDDFERFPQPILWRGQRITHICRDCWEK
jgi:hypothetical protein